MTAAMMNREDVKTEWEKPNANPLQGMSQQDINKLLEYRSELLMELSKHYAAFVEAIYKLPIHVVFRQHAFFNLDQAEMWAKKGVDNVWNLPGAKMDFDLAESGADQSVITTIDPSKIIA